MEKINDKILIAYSLAKTPTDNSIQKDLISQKPNNELDSTLMIRPKSPQPKTETVFSCVTVPNK